jgi:tetratricopeptide (TPR) repeat protein
MNIRCARRASPRRGHGAAALAALVLGLATPALRGADPADSPAATRPAGAPAAQHQRQTLRQALNAFDQAVAAAHSDARRAADLYRQAVAGFELLAAEGARNPGLEYNLGNAYYRLGDLGRAILHYRRAQRLAPRDGNVRANLEYARGQVQPLIRATDEDRWSNGLWFWQRATSWRQQLWIVAACSAVGWLLLILRLRWSRPLLLVFGLLFIAAGLLNAGLLGWELHDQGTRPPAIVVVGAQALRQGRGDAYEPVLKQPLGAGVEVRILHERADWAEVELSDGHTGWLPARVLERV